jgi:hypothetical protein
MTEVIVAITADTEDFQKSLDESRSRLDDGWWAHYVRLPYTPQRFINWWVARRWIIPRDIRRS